MVDDGLEVWLPIPGYPLYKVSNKGQVARQLPGPGTKVGYVLQPEEIKSRGSDTYLRVGLYNGTVATRKKVLVHVLVALAFHGEPELPDAKVDHLDTNTHNNRSDNLEWVTQSENVRRSWRAGGKRRPGVELEEIVRRR